MSVSLVVLRIEVEDSCPIPSSVTYRSAANILKMSTLGEVTNVPKDPNQPPDTGDPEDTGGLAAGTSNPCQKASGAKAVLDDKLDQRSETELEEHRGQRQMGDIRIVTYAIEHTDDEAVVDPIPDKDKKTEQSQPSGGTTEVPTSSYAQKVSGISLETSPARDEHIPAKSNVKPTLESDHTTLIHHHKKPGTKAKKIYSPSGSTSSGSGSESSRKFTSKSVSGRVVGNKTYASIVSNKEEAPTPRFFHVEPVSHHSGGFVQQLPSDFDDNDSPGPACSSSDHDSVDRGSMSRIPSKLPFFSGNPSVEITKGILHLFKENEMTSLDKEEMRSEMLCMLAVPASMTVHDLLQFTAPLSQGIELMRVIRDSTQNQYMVLIKFRQQIDADDFYNEFNGKPFNSLENPVCYLVYVSKVECMKAEEGACLPVPGLTELPTCHICLERMDESVDGILTILCNHSFHGNCLDQWSDTSCPVCRYCQTPELVEDHKCFVCGSQESLWICLICGHVGCGRYVDAHAYSHFEDTQHTYSLQLGNQRVWDYAGDNYVHRLVQTKGDGKPIEWDREGGGSTHEEKLDSLQLEYTYLLTSQLESQRIYFEDKMACIEQEALDRISEVEARSKKTVEELDRMDRRLQNTIKEKQMLERKCNQLSGKLNKVSTQLKEEKQMNECLVDNQHVWQEKMANMETRLADDSKQKQTEINELREQLRDVMFFLDAQQKISETSDDTRQEIQEGQIVVGAAAPDPAKRKGRKKGR